MWKRLAAAWFIVLFVASALSADSQAPDLGWYSVETEHFTFIYRPDHQAAVDELVTFADDVYDEVTGFFDTTTGRIRALVFGESDLANGYFTSAPPQHLGLYVAQQSLPMIDARARSWLRLLLIHEVTHFVQANYRPGLFHVLGSLFGRSLSGFSMAFTPLWLIEGIAVNTETVFTDGGRGRNPFFEMQYKAPTIEGRLWSLAQSSYDSYRAPTGRYYVAGYFIWDYLMTEYGPEFTARFMADFAGFPLLGVGGPLRTTTGESIDGLYQQATDELIQRYADDSSIEPAPRFSPSGRGDYHLPRVTDRGLYLYRTRPDRTPAIVRFDPEGDEEPLVEIRLTDPSSWTTTRSGDEVIFATLDADNAFPEEPAISSNLFRLDVESGTVERLTSAGGFYQPSVSPDGSTLVAVERDGHYQRLVRVDADTGATTPLFSADRLRVFTPDFSPDGTLVAFIANQEGDQRLVLLNPENGDARFLPTPNDGLPYFPTFADDDTLLYGHDTGGSLALYRHEIPTGRVTLAVADPVAAFAGGAYKDTLLVSSYTSDGYTLRRVSQNGDRTTQGVSTEEVKPDFRRIEPPEPVSGTPWVPVPWPALWFPTVGAAGPGLDPGGLGGGALVYGADPLNRHRWQLESIYFPALTQLDYTAQWTTTYGPLGFSLVAASQYEVYDLGTQQTHAKLFQHGGQLSYALLARYRLGVSERVSLSLAATQSLFFLSEEPFAITGINAPTVSLEADLISVRAALSAARTPLSSRQAFHVPGAADGTVSATLIMPAPAYAPEAVLGASSGRVNLGIAGSDHVIAFSPSVNFASTTDFASPYDLRGFGAATDHSASAGLRGRYRFAVDYHTPHNLMDFPIIAPLALTGVGLTFYAEATGGYDIEPLGAALDEAVGLGAEVTAVLNFWQDVPVVFGIQTRIRPAAISRYSLLEDTTFYIDSDLLDAVPAIPQYLRPGL
ncbi:MAG: TolB family protein [Spirochaetota bacterium]